VTRKQFLVSPDGGHWKVQSEDATLTRYISQTAAIRNAIDRANNHKDDAQVLVQTPSGQWRTELTTSSPRTTQYPMAYVGISHPRFRSTEWERE
jgi:hypothetical protein